MWRWTATRPSQLAACFVSPARIALHHARFQGGYCGSGVQDFANGTMLVVNTEGLSHVLSPKVPVRILFVAINGYGCCI